MQIGAIVSRYGALFAVLDARGKSRAVVPLAGAARQRMGGDVYVSIMGMDDAVAVCGSARLSTWDFEDTGLRLSRDDLADCRRAAARYRVEAEMHRKYARSDLVRDALV